MALLDRWTRLPGAALLVLLLLLSGCSSSLFGTIKVADLMPRDEDVLVILDRSASVTTRPGYLQTIKSIGDVYLTHNLLSNKSEVQIASGGDPAGYRIEQDQRGSRLAALREALNKDAERFQQTREKPGSPICETILQPAYEFAATRPNRQVVIVVVSDCVSDCARYSTPGSASERRIYYEAVDQFRWHGLLKPARVKLRFYGLPSYHSEAVLTRNLYGSGIDYRMFNAPYCADARDLNDPSGN